MFKDNSGEKLVEQYTSRDQGLIARFLTTKKYKMKVMYKSFPSYKGALFCKAISETIKAKYEEQVAFDIHWSGEIITASFQYLEVGRDNSEELLTSGYRLVTKDENTPLAIEVSQNPYTGAWILALSYNNKHSEESLEFFNDVETYMRDNNFYIGEKIDISGKFLSLNDMDFDEVILPEDNKKAIKLGALDFFDKKDIYLKNNLPYKLGLIYTGVPGTGKTLTGKILMNCCDSTFLWVSAGDLSDKYTAAGEKAKNLFNMARELAPCTLFIEDVDDFLEEEGAVDAIKTQMDGMDSLDGIVTILCTNFPDKLPMALIDRPSRFDDVIVFNLPDEDLRFHILNKISEPMDLDSREEVLKDIASKTEGLTGSHLKEIIVYALLLSADDGREMVSKNDLAKALKKVLDTKQTITDKLSEINVKCLVSEIKKNKESD
ncbi:MAG: AAA family ATPase [Candidatus Baldrarchaeia archaeon]